MDDPGQKRRRPGGRSARVVTSVHSAARVLLQEGCVDLDIGSIALHAGVTPSTIYRRWGSVGELLAEVALSMLLDLEQTDTGSGIDDLFAWSQRYAAQIAPSRGHQTVCAAAISRSEDMSRRYDAVIRSQLTAIAVRAKARQERFPDVDDIIESLVAPIIFRTIFGEIPTASDIRQLLSRLWQHRC